MLCAMRTERVVVDEMCVCGHPKSEHGSHTIQIPRSLIRLPATGNCCQSHCNCARFCWAAWIYKESRQRMLAL